MQLKLEKSLLWREKNESILKLLVIVLAFCIPLSTSLSSIVLMGILIFWLFVGNFKHRIDQIMHTPINQATFLFFGLYLLGVFYAGYTQYDIAWQDRLHALGKEAKLLIILLCLPILQDLKIRKQAFWAFMAAVSVTLLLSYIKFFTNLSIANRFTAPYVFRDSIHTSFILCFAMFIAAQYLLRDYLKKQVFNIRKPQVILLVIIITSIFFLFYMGHGRAGYFLFFALSLLFGVQWYKQASIQLRTLVLSVGFLGLFIIATSLYSPKFQVRISEIQTDISQFHSGNSDSSLGSRMEFLQNSLTLIKAHPLLGYGTGSFKSVYKHFAKLHEQQITDNPHNEYVHLIFQVGLLGCVLLLYWVWMALRERQKLPAFEKNCAEGMLLAMGIGCLANSWMTDFTSGYLFVYWIAFAFSAGLPNKKPQTLSVIVTTYNWPAALSCVLRSLLSQKSSIPYEILIADDGSREETAALIKSYQDKIGDTECGIETEKQENNNKLIAIKHIWHEDEGFRAAAIRNKAIQAAKGDYIIFLDGDSVPRQHFLERHVSLAEKDYFVVGNRILLSKPFTESVLSEQFPIHNWSLGKWFLFRMKGCCNRLSSLFSIPLGLFRFTKIKQWKGAKGCNLAVWKTDLFKVNGWDEQFSGWGYEDSDLVIRLIRAGIQRKEGRFSVPIIHLWHKENDRSLERHNWLKLETSFKQSTFLASMGLKENNGIS